MGSKRWRAEAMNVIATYDGPGPGLYEKHMVRMASRWRAMMTSRRVTQGLIDTLWEELTGPVPDDSQLIIPVECPAKSSASYFVYFDNPSAPRVPDFLPPQTGFFNGDVERGAAATPFGWKHDQGDDRCHADDQRRPPWQPNVERIHESRMLGRLHVGLPTTRSPPQARSPPQG